MPIEFVAYKENREETLVGINEYTFEKIPALDMRHEEVSFVYKENNIVLG